HELNEANPAYRINGRIDLKGYPVFNTPPCDGRASYIHTFHVLGGTLDATAEAFYRDAHTVGYPTRYSVLTSSPSPAIQALAALQGTVGPAPATNSTTIAD